MRRIESRLLSLVGMFVLVLMLMHEAGKPQRWKWLWAFQPDAWAGSADPDAGNLDTRIRSPLAPTQPADSVTVRGMDLSEIRDNTVAFANREQDAWFRLLETLQRTDLEQLERDSCGQVGFAQLYREPHVYRGRLVTVRGTVRLGYYRPAPQNLRGIASYYILWLRPVGSTNPMVIYALDVPAGFPDVKAIEAAGSKPELHEDVEFTGYFFKRWAYRAEDGMRLAPVILAKMPRWQPSELASRIQPEGRPSLPVLALCIAGAVVLAVLFVVLATRPTRHRGVLRTSLPPTDGEVKRQLAELTKQDPCGRDWSTHEDTTRKTGLRIGASNAVTGQSASRP